MTEIEELIEQAKKVLKAWKRPNYDELPHERAKPWQKLMDEREVPLRIGYKG